MEPHARSAAGGERVPRLAPGCDPSRLELSPAEGFLLSRIDGRTPRSLLREIGGLPPGEVDSCLERWVGEGIVVEGAGHAESSSGGVPAADRAAPSGARSGGAAAPAIDPSLELSEADQRRILQFLELLDRPYYEILGVAPDADAREIKRAYFRLSKDFHPDRYFRREIGPYRGCLDRVFKKIVEAYELLSDPTTRSEVDRALREPAEPGAAGAVERRAAGGGPRGLDLFSRVLAERRRKAKRFYEAGMDAYAKERWLEAAASVRLAIAFDPKNEAFRDGFLEVVSRANEVRAVQLLREADAALDMRRPKDALALYEEVMHLRPRDAEVSHTAARLSWLVAEDLRRAKEYATAACDADPENAGYRRTLGQIYKAAGLKANARRELGRALRLDPKDAEAKRELRAIGRS